LRIAGGVAFGGRLDVERVRKVEAWFCVLAWGVAVFQTRNDSLV